MPYPVIASSLDFKKLGFKDEGEFTDGAMNNYLRHYYGNKLPPVILTFVNHSGFLIYNDPVSVHELYVTKNKIVEKYTRLKKIAKDLFGDSILIDKTTDLTL